MKNNPSPLNAEKVPAGLERGRFSLILPVHAHKHLTYINFMVIFAKILPNCLRTQRKSSNFAVSKGKKKLKTSGNIPQTTLIKIV